MKFFKNALILLAVLSFPVLAFSSGKTELNLWKRNDNLYGPCGHCADFVNFSENENRKDFSEFNLYDQDGYYTVNLTGSAGTMVTLYGDRGFDTDHGYLVIVKKDDRMVEVEDLEAFAPGQWVDINTQEGSYSAFYRSNQNFKTRVASVKWGKWWTGSNP